MAKVFSICFLLLACVQAAAQSNNPPPPKTFQISGQVTDSVGNALASATVQYTASTDTVNTLTDNNGAFSLHGLPSRKFTLHVTIKGYVGITKIFQIGIAKVSEHLPTIVLQNDYLDLQPVVISQVRPVTFGEDTISYHVSAFPLRDGSAVQDLLKRLPGMEFDMDGNVIVQGKKITKVLVDGKEFFGGNVALAIQNLPAAVVSQLQVIDDYGDKARLTGVRSGDADKVLNIVLRSDKHKGQFANLDAAAGNQGKYAANAFANAFDGPRQIAVRAGLHNNSPGGTDPVQNGGVNYADEWGPRWSLASSISTAGQAPQSVVRMTTDNYYPGEQLQQTQENLSDAHSDQTNLNSRLTFKPDNHTTFRLNTAGTLQSSASNTTSTFSTLQQDSGYTKTTNGTSINQSHNAGPALHSNLYFEKIQSESRRRFSLEADIRYNGAKASTNIESRASVVADSSTTASYLHYVTSNNTASWNGFLNATYFLPVGRTSFLEIGYRAQSYLTRSNLATRAADAAGDTPVPVDSLSQQTTLNSTSQSAHTGYSTKIHQLNLSAGLDVQTGRLKGTADAKGDLTGYHYLSVLPTLQSNWNVTKEDRIQLSYSGQPTLPTLAQLSPLTNLSNPQYPVTGNPALKQSYSHNASVGYEHSDLKATQFFGYGVGLGYVTMLHSIISNLVTPKDGSQVIQATTYVNAGTTNNLSANIHLTLPSLFHKRFRIMLGGNAARTESITMTDSVKYLNLSWNWAPYVHLQLMIPDVFEADLSANYNLTRNTYPRDTVPPTSFRTALMNLSVRQYFFRKWILNYQLVQSYTSTGSRLQAVPASLTASIQRQFLAQNRATVTLAGYNLFNQNTAVGQSASPTTVIQSSPQLTGRYFLVSFQLKLQRFH